MADYVRGGIYELRAKCGHVNYRVLYFFHGRHAVILTNGFTKQAKIPTGEITRAQERKRLFEGNPDGHTYEEDVYEGVSKGSAPN